MAILSDGTIVFPHNGRPPRPPDGYDVDPGDPYVFHPQWDPCKHRLTQEYLKECRKIGHRQRCKLLCKEVSAAICLDCEVTDR